MRADLRPERTKDDKCSRDKIVLDASIIISILGSLVEVGFYVNFKSEWFAFKTGNCFEKC